MAIYGLAGGVNKQFSAHHGLVSGVNKEIQSIYGLGGGVNKEVYSANVNIASVPTNGTTTTFSSPQLINTIEFDFVITYQSGKTQSEHIFYIKMKNAQGSIGSIGLKVEQYYDSEYASYEKYLYIAGDRTNTLGDRTAISLGVTNGNVSGIKHHIKYTMLSSGKLNVHVNDVLLISEYSIYDLCGISTNLMALSCYSEQTQIPVTITNLVIK